MHLDEFRSHCLSKKGATEDMPFGPNVLVFRVGGKIFALSDIERPIPAVNLKCDPDRALALRDQYTGIVPGYHMNKKHWNTVSLQADVPGRLIRELIDHAYETVLHSLPTSIRNEFGC